GGVQVDRVAGPAARTVARPKAHDAAFLADPDEAEQPLQQLHRPRRRNAVQQGAGKSLDSLVRGKAGERPAARLAGRLLLQFQLQPFMVPESDRLSAEPPDALVFHAVPAQAVFPERKRPRRGGKTDPADLPAADASLPAVLEREERHDGARRSPFVAIVKMVDVGRVEVDGFFHQPKPQHPGVKIQIGLGAAREGGDVVDAPRFQCAIGHGRFLAFRWDGTAATVRPLFKILNLRYFHCTLFSVSSQPRHLSTTVRRKKRHRTDAVFRFLFSFFRLLYGAVLRAANRCLPAPGNRRL